MLLPASLSCVTVVTSRDALAGLVAREGAQRLDLDLLSAADAGALLRALIGARAVADPAATAALAVQCCRLPLALRVVAELAVARPAAPLADLVKELADQRRRLDLLDAGGDPRTAVRAVFSWSGRQLDSGAARMFRLTGLHPGTDVDRYAAAALAGATLEQASRMLNVLARACLIQFAGPGRYTTHDLLRSYAAELAATDSQDEHQAALTRLFDYYVGTAAAAMDTLYPAERHRRPGVLPPVTPVPPVTGHGQARAWLDAERASLVAATRLAADGGWPGHATRLAATLSRYLDTGGHYSEAITIHGCARRAARLTGDLAAEASALTCLGVADWRQGRYQQAGSHLRQALSLHRETGDLAGEAAALGNLGLVNWRQGRYRQAAGHYRQALALYRKTADRSGEARALGNLGDIDRRQGRYPQAISHHREALALHRQTGHRPGEADALVGLGDVAGRQGRYQEADSHYQHALVLYQETGNRSGEAQALAGLGDVAARQGLCQQAARYYQRALARYRKIGNRTGEAEALNGLGEALLSVDQPDQAHRRHAAALALASQIGDTYQQARAYRGLGAYHAAGRRPGQARRHWQRALTLYRSLGAPEAEQVRVSLRGAAPVT